MELHLHIDEDRLTFDDMIAIEEAQENRRTLRTSKEVMAKFLTNGDGNYLPYDDAFATLGKLSIKEVMKLVEVFQAEVERLSANPTNGAS